jgi:hypothetical protein
MHMSWLFFTIFLSAIALFVYMSVKGVKQKKIQMHKEKYELAIKGGDPHKIKLAQQEYHALIQPKRKHPVIYLPTRKKHSKNTSILVREAV